MIIVEEATGCWLWQGSIDRYGYGQRRYRGSLTTAHRAVYQELWGPISAGLDLDHLCRVPRCVNPDHMEPVSRQTNVLRGEGVAARYAARTHCAAGHALQGDNLYIHPNGSRRCRACKREARRHAA
jgi:hypothetical protein